MKNEIITVDDGGKFRIAETANGGFIVSALRGDETTWPNSELGPFGTYADALESVTA